MGDINWGSVGSGAATGASAGATVGPWGAVIGGIGGAIVGGITGSQASGQLQQGQANARQAIQQGTTQAAGYQQPYYDLGTKNATTLSNMVNNGSFNVDPYNYQMGQAPGAYQQTPFNFQQDPGYQFQLQQGLNSVQNSAAAGGSLLSGSTMQALQKYGTDLAAQDYNNAYQRYVQGQNLGLNVNENAYNQFAKTSGLGMENAQNTYSAKNQQANQNFGRFNDMAQMGVGAGNQLSNLYNQQGQSLASSYLGTGNAQAQGTLAVGNSINKGLTSAGQFADYYMGQPLNRQQNPNYNNNSQPWMQNQQGQGSPWNFSNSTPQGSDESYLGDAWNNNAGYGQGQNGNW
jgi:hypothetical protein